MTPGSGVRLAGAERGAAGKLGYRLWLYVDAYGLTRWRCAAGIGGSLLVVASGLLLILWRIFRRKEAITELVDARLLVVGLLLGACAWIDVDAVIAWQNVLCHTLSTDRLQGIDIPYLESYSAPPRCRPWPGCRHHHGCRPPLRDP